MHYLSTRDLSGGLDDTRLDFEAAMLTGLAPDGGLYVPEVWPSFTDEQIASLKDLPYEELAFRVMKPFIGAAFDDADLRRMIDSAYANFAEPTRCPLSEIENNHHLLELYHGPTLAFKDFAMQLIGQMFNTSLTRSGTRRCILGATSGDTGSAAIEAFQNLPAVDVFILYPQGRVSDVQRRQMTTATAPNVHAVAIDGDFDDCQALVKAMFADVPFRETQSLASVNSINWGRILAQVVYYFSAASRLGAPERAVSFCVPTGNFGDIFAGYVAKKMGLGMGRLIIATNQNDILHRTLLRGEHISTGVEATFSPSMDIQVSSNFERLVFEIYGRDAGAVCDLFGNLRDKGGFVLSPDALANLRRDFASGRCSEEETLATIKDIYQKNKRMICPHTAVGVKVAREFLAGESGSDSGSPIVTLATAHPAKFPQAVASACGATPNLPPHLSDLANRPERLNSCPNNLTAIQTFIKERRT